MLIAFRCSQEIKAALSMNDSLDRDSNLTEQIDFSEGQSANVSASNRRTREPRSKVIDSTRFAGENKAFVKTVMVVGMIIVLVLESIFIRFCEYALAESQDM
jgi:hypothetical protein